MVSLSDRRVHVVRKEAITYQLRKFGGPKWTRTTDLTLIRRAL